MAGMSCQAMVKANATSGTGRCAPDCCHQTVAKARLCRQYTVASWPEGMACRVRTSATYLTRNCCVLCRPRRSSGASRRMRVCASGVSGTPWRAARWRHVAGMASSNTGIEAVPVLCRTSRKVHTLAGGVLVASRIRRHKHNEQLSWRAQGGAWQLMQCAVHPNIRL